MPMNTRCTPVASVAAVGWSPTTALTIAPKTATPIAEPTERENMLVAVATPRSPQATLDWATTSAGAATHPIPKPISRQPSATCHSDAGRVHQREHQGAGHGEADSEQAGRPEADAEVEPPGQRRRRPASRASARPARSRSRSRRRRSRPGPGSARRTTARGSVRRRAARARSWSAARRCGTPTAAAPAAAPRARRARTPPAAARRPKIAGVCHAVPRPGLAALQQPEHDQGGGQRSAARRRRSRP